MSLQNAPVRRARPCREAFTLVELLVVMFIIGLLIAILIPALGAARQFARKGKDSTQVRSIAQGLGVWAGQNNGAFPRPSTLDQLDYTVDASGYAPAVKDNTGNIISILIFNGFMEAEQAHSPVENNENIVVDGGYERDAPSRAQAPEKSMALWDPGFAGFPGEQDSFTGVPDAGRRKGDSGQSVGHNSYALAFPFGERADQWRGDFDARQVLSGNRGPQYRLKDGEQWILEDTPLGKRSNTVRFYGGEDSWEGHLAYGDGHVEISTSPTPEGLRFSATGANSNGTPSSFLDNVFVNEIEVGQQTGRYNATLDTRPDLGSNAFIRIWGNVTSEIGSSEVTIPAVGNRGSDGNFVD